MSSHRARAAETMPSTTRLPSSDGSVPQMTRNHKLPSDSTLLAAQKRSSIASVTSSGRRSSASVDSLGKPLRPSGLPRSTSASSQARLSQIASMRPIPTYAGRSPPLQALAPSKVGLPNHPKLDTSRVYLSPQPPSSSMTMSPMEYDDDLVLGIALPIKKNDRLQAQPLPSRLIPELQALAAANSRIPQPQPPSSSISSIGSPSTIWTASPSPWSASTTTTTPISWSSASPSVVQTTKSHTNGKRSQTIPMPAPPRAKMPHLPVLKETSAIPVAKSQVNEQERDGSRRSRKHTPIASPAPTPPPRSSSVKRGRSRSNSAATNRSEPQLAIERVSEHPPLPGLASGSRTKDIRTPVIRSQPPISDVVSPSDGHTRLQEAINFAPARPSREGVRSIAIRHVEPVNQNLLYESRQRQLMEAAPIDSQLPRRSQSKGHNRKMSSSDTEGTKQSARSRLAKFSKLALFGRSKEKEPLEPERKLQKTLSKKGPAAGTGHEGYSKFTRRGRKSSIGGSSVAATDSETSIASETRRPLPKRQSRSLSRKGSESQSDLDDFASSRLKPVIIRGGSRKSLHSPIQRFNSEAQRSDISVTTVSSAATYSSYSQPTVNYAKEIPSRSHGTDERSTLAGRRSQKFADSFEAFKFPEPIQTQDLTATPCLDSRNTTHSSDIATPINDMHRVDYDPTGRQPKTARLMNWFRRKASISEPVEQPIEIYPTQPEMSVSVANGPAQRSMPYYALLESESEVNPAEGIAEYLKEATHSPEDARSLASNDEPAYPGRQERPMSVLLPVAPARRASSPQLQDPYDSPQPRLEDVPAPFPDLGSRTKQPRLAQVGRIPKVVHSSAPAQSYAQPTTALPALPKLRTQHAQLFSSSYATTRDAQQSFAPRRQPQEVPIYDNMYARSNLAPRSDAEFLRISDARTSDFTTTSSGSDGIISIMGPLPPASTGLISPPDFEEEEDEIWDEYDDFIDHVMSPPRFLKSIQKNKGLKTRELNSLPRTTYKATDKPPSLSIVPANVTTTRPPRQHLGIVPGLLISTPPLQQMSSQEEIRLRRSRIADALRSSSYASFAPSSPFSMRDFIAEYGRPGSGRLSDRGSVASSSAAAPVTQAYAEPQIELPSIPKQSENAARMDEVARGKDAAKQSERSYASLMVSRWLSFGRVLFSPAHNLLQEQQERHVLVIDGLGNEDWSIYCAVTYQAEKAFVYDLKEKNPSRRRTKPTKGAETRPPNHRQQELASFEDRFPYPPDFFEAIVLRFPPTMTDAKLKNIISESRRVLAPGGFLELMVLDLDIVNMGVATRRAIKELKIKMTAADRNVSLKPIIDNVQTVLGSRGFTNLSRCVVGVPVVGKPSGSGDSSSDSRSSHGSQTHQRRSSAGPRPFGSIGSHSNFSLNDLVADHSDKADAKIGRMVSRTARSWWQHCFEATVIADGNVKKSVLANKPILGECKSRGSSFKLLIAYTQKPGLNTASRRRTMSEPTVPSLATVGVSRG